MPKKTAIPKKTSLKRKMAKPTVLSIAGSDSSAGAGLQADLKTFSTLGCHGLTAVTCVVAETPLEVRSIHPVPLDIFRDQLEILFESYPIDAIKTGLLCTPEQVAIVCKLLQDRDIPLVVDPVMVASTGDTLQTSDSLGALKKLLTLATVITPNFPEAEILLNRKIQTSDDQESAAHALAKQFATACYLKGGHSASNREICDLLVKRDGAKRALKAPFQKIPQTHGTGCTLAAAFAVGLAEKRTIYEAAHQAHQFTQRAIRDSHSWKVPGTDEVIMHLDQVQGQN